MDVRLIIPIVIFSIVTVVIAYVLINKKKFLSKFMRELESQLLASGIKVATTIDNNYYLTKLGETVKNLKRDIEGVCDVTGQDFDYLCHRSDELHYFVVGKLHHTDDANQVKTGWLDNVFYKRVTQLSIKKGILPWGRVSNILWEGDTVLATKLNGDAILTDKLMQLLLRKKEPKKVLIYWKEKYAGIRTEIYKLEAEDFEIMNRIARHIKSAWFKINLNLNRLKYFNFNFSFKFGLYRPSPD